MESPRPNKLGAPTTQQSQLVLTAGIGVQDLRLAWPQVLAAVRLRRRTVEILLRDADLVSIDDGILRFGAVRGIAHRLMEPAKADVVTQALGSVVGLD